MQSITSKYVKQKNRKNKMRSLFIIIIKNFSCSSTMLLLSSSHFSTMSSSSRIISSNCHSISVPKNSSESSISIITCVSSKAANSSSSVQPHTTGRIKFLLKQQSSTYTVIKNEKKEFFHLLENLWLSS